MNQQLRPSKAKDVMVARVYTLAEYAQKDEHGAGPKGREFQIRASQPFTDATVRPLAEVAASA